MHGVLPSRYSPRHASPELLEATFVLDPSLAEDMVARVVESARSSNKHHLLVVGPRGAGKSHLAALVANRAALGGDAPWTAWIDADDTPQTFLKLLLRLRQQLAARHPEAFVAEVADAAAFARDHAAAARLIGRQLVDAIGDRCVLLILENLDQLLRNLGDAGQKELRAFLQEHPRFALLGTSRTLTDDVVRREAPFFGFFQVERLCPLGLEATGRLFTSLATLHGDAALVGYLGTDAGAARVRALHELTRGNARLCVVVAGYLDAGSLDALVDPVRAALDELHPYFLGPVRALPPQLREIVEFLCACTRPVPVKAIQTALLGSHSTAASELKKLREKGLVVNERRGRESLYEVAEPWLRRSWQLHGWGDDGLRQLVGLLRAWFDGAAELAGRLDAILGSATDPRTWQADLTRLAAEAREQDAAPRLAAGLLAHLKTLAEVAPLAEVRRAWAAAWEQVAATHEELALAARLCRAGVDLLEGDAGAARDLVDEERRLLQL